MPRPQIYINVGQVLGILVGGACAFEYIKYLEYQAGMTGKPLSEMIFEKIRNFRTTHQMW